MSKKRNEKERSYEILRDLVGHDIVVEIWRERFDPYPLLGFPIALSENILVLNLVDKTSLSLNGYSAVRLRDMTSWSIDDTFVTRALRLLSQKPTSCSGIAVTDWASLITWVQSNYSLVIIESEKEAPGALYIGRVAAQTKRGISLHELDKHACWEKQPTKHKYSSITQVEFDSGYSHALAAIVEHEERLNS